MSGLSPSEHWLARLIAHPTISADSNLPLIAEVEAALTAAGAICERFPDETGQKAALLARFGPDLPGGLMLSGHVDVVPVAGQNWSRPAFAMQIDGDRIYGRGSADMKGFVAAMLALAEGGALQQAEGLKRPLWLALSYDEEIGCIGVRPMLASLAARGLRPDLVLVGEPTSMRLGLGHKGKMAFKVTFRGVTRHSAEAPLALNALHPAAAFTLALHQMQVRLATSGARESGYHLPYSTVHVGRLAGGSVVNVVPDRAELLVEIRHVAQDDPQALTAELQRHAEAALAQFSEGFPEAAVTVEETGSYPGLAADPADPAISAMAACLPPATENCRLSFGTEGGLFARDLGVPVVICGPGNMDQGHKPDEYGSRRELALCDALLLRLLQAFCR